MPPIHHLPITSRRFENFSRVQKLFKPIRIRHIEQLEPKMNNPRGLLKKATFLPAQPRSTERAPCPGQGHRKIDGASIKNATSVDAGDGVSRLCPEANRVSSYPPTLSLPRQALFLWPYGELLRDARTPLADFFSSLP